MIKSITFIGLLVTTTALYSAHDGQVPSAAPQPDYRQVIDIHSATDTKAITPVIAAFELRYPQYRVKYQEYESAVLYRRMQTPGIAGADVVISSAMDLQIMLINDGKAQRINAPEADELPGWARWRDEVFGFTFEPVIVAYNRAAFAEQALPRTHEGLVNLLRKEPGRFQGKVGTYDIRMSGTGYLFASQDAMVSDSSGRVQESLARAVAQTYCCTSAILDGIASGDLLIGYNLIGSYALARARQDSRIGLLMPEDYTLVMSRLAFVPKQTDNLAGAETFIRFLLSREGQQVISEKSNLIALHPEANGPSSIGNISEKNQLRFSPIKVALPLLTYQDFKKREHFLREWTDMFMPPDE